MTDSEPVEVKGLADALNNLVKVIAASQIHGLQGTDKKARFLKVFGLRNSEIADLIGVSDQAVDQALKKEKKKRTPPPDTTDK
jgi:hypothetical protein